MAMTDFDRWFFGQADYLEEGDTLAYDPYEEADLMRGWHTEK